MRIVNTFDSIAVIGHKTWICNTGYLLKVKNENVAVGCEALFLENQYSKILRVTNIYNKNMSEILGQNS